MLFRRLSDETVTELEMIIGFDDDLAAESTWIKNRLRAFSPRSTRQLERVLGPRPSSARPDSVGCRDRANLATAQASWPVDGHSAGIWPARLVAEQGVSVSRAAFAGLVRLIGGGAGWFGWLAGELARIGPRFSEQRVEVLLVVRGKLGERGA